MVTFSFVLNVFVLLIAAFWLILVLIALQRVKNRRGPSAFLEAHQLAGAVQIASGTEQQSNIQGGRSWFQSVLSVGFLVCVILYALTALLFPQAVAFRGPANGWLSAHRFAEAALAIALNAIWWGVRIRLSYSAAWHSKAEIERLKLK